MAVSKKIPRSILTSAESFHDTITAIPQLEGEIINKTVLSRTILASASASACADCIFRLYINSELKEVLYNNWCERNVAFSTQQNLALGDSVIITCEHNASENQEIHATIVLMEY